MCPWISKVMLVLLHNVYAMLRMNVGSLTKYLRHIIISSVFCSVLTKDFDFTASSRLTTDRVNEIFSTKTLP